MAFTIVTFAAALHARWNAIVKTYLATARRIVKEFGELNDWVRDTRLGEKGRLAVGFYTSFTAGNLRATLTGYSDHFPGVRVRSFERDRDMLLEGIENGLLDIAIMMGEARYPNLSSHCWKARQSLTPITRLIAIQGRRR